MSDLGHLEDYAAAMADEFGVFDYVRLLWRDATR